MADEQDLIYRIEAAATSLLTDQEIQDSLALSDQQMQQHADLISRTRLSLKQRLNARRIADAAQSKNGKSVEGLVDQIPISRRGGARPGAGRKPGTTNKISGATILTSVEHYTGERFEDLLAQGYAEAINNRDTMVRLAYEKMFLSKVVADKIEMDISESEASMAAKQAAFQAALLRIAGNTIDAK